MPASAVVSPLNVKTAKRLALGKKWSAVGLSLRRLTFAFLMSFPPLQLQLQTVYLCGIVCVSVN